MKRRAAALTAVAILAVGVVYAWAAPASIIAGVGTMNMFSSPGYPHDAGTVATMTWAGGTGSHNVTAYSAGPDGKALFRSATIGSGSTSVGGTQYIPAGTYGFFCTVHGASMSSSLTVTGTPLPPPAVGLKILSKTLGSKIKVQETSASTSGAPSGSILAKLGKTTLTKDAILSVAPGGSSTIKLKLSSAGRKKLSGRSSAKIKVIGTPDFGSPVSVKKKLS